MIELRNADRADVPAILELIRELATYERAPDEVVATEADLLRDGFGGTPSFQVLLAELDREIVGFAFYFYNYSTWLGRKGLYLEDLYVRPSHRRRGVGKALLLRLARIAVRERCGRFQWQVLDWNQPAIDFYESLGATVHREWLTVRLSGPALSRLADTAG